LAKAVEGPASKSDPSISPTLTRHATAAGIILGTAGYMSPEQARGQATDKRSDIWSFGVVYYEMLVGQKLFAGDTVSDQIAAVLRAKPDFDLLPKSVPKRVRELLDHCLRKDPRDRLRDVGDVSIWLDRNDEIGTESQPELIEPESRVSLLSYLPWILLTSLIALYFIGWNPFKSEPPEVAGFNFSIPTNGWELPLATIDSPEMGNKLCFSPLMKDYLVYFFEGWMNLKLSCWKVSE